MFSTEHQHKIVFTGPVGAGKTTAIRALSDIEPISTEQLATDETKEMKEETTVAMDYGSMMLGSKERIHLYGTPGQKRFDFMWEILAQGSIGLVVLLNNRADDPVNDMCKYLESFDNFLKNNKLAIGVNFVNSSAVGQPVIDDYSEALRQKGFNPPVFEVDCRETVDVSMLVQSLIYSCDPWLGR